MQKTSGSAPGPPRSPPLPQRGAFPLVQSAPRFPHLLGCGMGRHHFRTPPGHHTMACGPGAYFFRFFRELTRLPSPTCARSTPPSWPLLCHPRVMTGPRPLSSPSSLHTSPSLHTLVLPPGVLPTGTSPPPYIPAHERGDLPIRVAPCALESSHPPGYSPHDRHRHPGWLEKPSRLECRGPAPHPLSSVDFLAPQL